MEAGLFAELTIKMLAETTQKSIQFNNEHIAKAPREAGSIGDIRIPASWNTGPCAADNGDRKDETLGQMNAGKESITNEVDKLRTGIEQFTVAVAHGPNTTEVIETLVTYMKDFNFEAAVQRMGHNKSGIIQLVFPWSAS